MAHISAWLRRWRGFSPFPLSTFRRSGRDREGSHISPSLGGERRHSFGHTARQGGAEQGKAKSMSKSKVWIFPLWMYGIRQGGR